MNEMGNAYNVWSDNLNGKGHVGDLGVDGRIISKQTFQK
jgi:hypothetical protein